MMEMNEQDFIEKYNEIKQIETALLSPVQAPIAYILGGQPGAGKTSIQTELVRNEPNILIINADNYREHHPHFDIIQAEYGDESPKYTQPFINSVTERLIEDLSNEKYNLIVEGTLRTSEVPLSTAKKLKEKGYRTELCVMAVKPEISYESTILRYENAIVMGEIPRATSKAHHDMVVDRILGNLDYIYESKMFDCIKIYTRDKGCIYDSDTSLESPFNVENNIIFGQWSDYEKESINSIIRKIRELKQNRNSDDLQEYITHSDSVIEKINTIQTDRKYDKISNLSAEQVALLFATKIPFQYIKRNNSNITVLFRSSDSESIKSILSNTNPKKETKIKL